MTRNRKRNPVKDQEFKIRKKMNERQEKKS